MLHRGDTGRMVINASRSTHCTADPGILAAVAGLGLFEGLDDAVCERLAAGARLTSWRSGEVICREGEPGNGLHVVIRGQVMLTLQAGNGNERVFDLIGPGATFGEPSLYTDQPHLVTAEAIVDSELLQVSGSALLREIGGTPELALRVIRHLAQRIYRRTSDLKSYMLMSGTQRVICYLLHEVPFRTDGRQAVDVVLPVRKRLIASRLNLTQEHFSRILHELAEAALIRVEGQRVRILEPDRLRAWATR